MAEPAAWPQTRWLRASWVTFGGRWALDVPFLVSNLPGQQPLGEVING